MNTRVANDSFFFLIKLNSMQKFDDTFFTFARLQDTTLFYDIII